MSYQLVGDLQKKACPKGAVTVSQACRLLDVSRSGYYANVGAHKQRLGSPAVCAASVHLKAAFAASHKAYGSRRLATAMAERGLAMGRHRVRALMRLNGIRPVWRRKFVHTTHSKHTMAVSTNVLNRQFAQALPNQVWVCDIAYIRTRSGWLYLAGRAGFALAQDCGMGHGYSYACGAGVRGVADGYRSKKSSTWVDCAFRQRHAICQRSTPSAAEKVWPDWQHEPQGKLLG